MANGYIQTAKNVSTQLKDLNRDYYGRKRWQGLYDTVYYQKEQAMNNLESDYNAQVAEAYKTAYANKASVANSMLGSGFKSQAEADIDIALQEAFNTYKQNYLNSASQIESSADTAIAGIDKALNEEAQNYVDYQNSAYSYLQYLYNQAYPGLDADYEADENLLKMFAENPEWSKYIVKENVGTENETSRLMTEQELYARNYDIDEHGEGTLNQYGVNFYDQMLNQLSTENSNYSFHSWLSKENPELYEWSISPDEYNFTEAGTKMGSFKKMMGLKSTDEQYEYIERNLGLTEQEAKTVIADALNNLAEISNDGDIYATSERYNEAIDSITELIDELPIDDKTKASINQYTSGVKDAITEGKEHVDPANFGKALEHYLKVWMHNAKQPRTLKQIGSGADLFVGFAYVNLLQEMKPGWVKDNEAKERVKQSYTDLLTFLSTYAKSK